MAGLCVEVEEPDASTPRSSRRLLDTFPSRVLEALPGDYTAHRIHVFNGDQSPYASSFDPATGAWTHRTFDANWNAGSSFSGGIAVTPDSIFASDSGNGIFTNPGGIIRFDRSSGDSIRFGQSNLFGFSQVSLGLDQLLYATRDDVRATDVVVYDPETMAEVERLALGVGVVTDATADADGNLYVIKPSSPVVNDGSILKLDRDGNLLASLDLDTGNLRDIDLVANGVIVATSHDDGDVFVSDTSLQSYSRFRVFPGDRIFAAIVPVPEPSTASLLALGILGLAAGRSKRRRR